MKTYLLILSIVLGLAFSAHAQERPNEAKQAQWEQFKANEGENWNIRWKGETGVPRVVSNGLTKAYTGSAESIAQQFLNEYRQLFSLKNELADLNYVKTQTNQGVRHVTFSQHYKDLPVEGGEYKVHIREDGRVDMANGHYYQGIQLSISPSISGEQAINLAKIDLKLENPTEENSSAELIVYPLTDSTFILLTQR
tara:strand:- start:26 stop:613 length:588 start_codon:yes stop_codon:yes gene_type:complete